MRKKQGLLIICDGLGDRPIERIGNETPLEHASTHNLDHLVSLGMCGNVYPFKPGIRVGTDVGHLLILGYDAEKYYYGRGPIEAASGGIELQAGDVAFRGNFATIDKDFRIVDRRAGRITEGTAELAAALNTMQLSDDVKVIAKELTSHRLAVVLRGPGLSADVSDTDPGATHEGEKLADPCPLKSTPEAKRTANLIREFSKKAHDVLSELEINKKRQAEKLLPANAILLRSAGMMGVIPPVGELYSIKTACIAGDKTILGLTRMAGFDVYTDDRFTGGFDTWIQGKVEKAFNLLKSGYDWVLVHVKATDLAGHDNEPQKKIEIIEKVDEAIGFLLHNLDLGQCYVGLTADHSTPCEVGDHSGDAVPTILAGSDVRKDGICHVGEKYFCKGSLHNLTARDIFMLQMDFMGRTEKYGS